MIKAGIDQDAIVKMFTEASAKQGDMLRNAVGDAVLKALRGRELTMGNIKKVLETVTAAATKGAARNVASPPDLEAMLGTAFAGMDGALLQAVEANRMALQKFVDQGAGLQEKQLKDAVANIERMEDTFLATVSKVAQAGAGEPTQGPWMHVLSAMKTKGTDTGAHAAQAVEQLMAQARSAVQEGRTSSAKTTRAMLDGYAALVSGVLIGMSDGLQQGTAPGKARATRP